MACLSGNLNTVQALVDQDVELESVDFNGSTPKKLAEGNFSKILLKIKSIILKGRKHWDISRYLEKAVSRQNSIMPSIDIKTLIFGPPGRSKTAMHFMLSMLLFMAYPTYLLKILPLLTVEGKWIAIIISKLF